jgi:uncharacterized membrane protein YcaP (DUF421 family)
MDVLPQPPKLARRFEDRGRLIALVAGFSLLPALAIAGTFERAATTSVLHVLLAFAVLTLAFRVMGKRELSNLSPFQLVTLMLIPEILSSSVQGEAPLSTALAGLSTILLLVLGTSLLSHRFPRVKDALEAPPTVLVSNGKLLERAMNSERISPDELYSEMRNQSVADLSDVRFAVLESGGKITFVRHAPTPDSES